MLNAATVVNAATPRPDPSCGAHPSCVWCMVQGSHKWLLDMDAIVIGDKGRPLAVADLEKALNAAMDQVNRNPSYCTCKGRLFQKVQQCI